MISSARYPNFTDALAQLEKDGFVCQGQDGALAHMFTHNNGTEARLTRDFWRSDTGYLVEIRRAA